MPQILRKSLTACDALAALPPTPRMNRRPPAARHAASSRRHALDRRRVDLLQDLGGLGQELFGECHRDLRNSVEIARCPSTRADLVEPLGRFPRRQLAAPQQALIDGGQVVGRSAGTSSKAARWNAPRP